MCHTVDPYIMAGGTTALYTCLALAKVAPQVDVEIFVNVMDCLNIFSCVLRTCGPNFNLLSICRPNTLISILGSISVLAILMDAVMLNLLGFLDKCMSSYFVGSNTDPCREAYFSHCLYIASRVLQFSSVLFPYAKMLESSTNPIALIFLPGRSHISNRSAL